MTWTTFEIGQVAAGVGGTLAALAAGAKLWEFASPRLHSWHNRRTLRFRVGAELYDPQEIWRSTKYYIPPDFQSVDPSGGEDFRKVLCAREAAFPALDRALLNSVEHKFIIVLADSGMGKTSLVLNYYAQHWRSARRRRWFDLHLVPLNIRDSNERIQQIPVDRRPDTVLFLDAFDEDKEAINDHRKRFAELFEMTKSFRCVVFTCRTQFFPKDEEIPSETGILRLGPVPASSGRVHYLHKVYLAPFTDTQVSQQFTWSELFSTAKELSAPCGVRGERCQDS